MRVHGLRGENIMRMRHFNLDFDTKGNMIVISGKNGEGKSSLINSLVLGLGGSKTDVARLTTKPIREGEDGAWVEIDLDEYTVRRQWRSNDKDALTITGKNGAKFASPQKMLDKILGDLSFDPLAFTRMKPKEQKELLLSIVDIPLDLAAHDARYDENFEKRTAVGRERDRLKGAWDSSIAAGDLSGNVPDEEISVSKLSEELQDFESHNRDYENNVSKLAEVERLIKEGEDALERMKNNRTMLNKWFNDDNDKIDTMELKQKIHDADEINKAVRAKKSRAELKAAYEEQEARYAKGTQFLANLDAEKAKALKEAEMPVDGLSLDADGVTFNDIPFGQLSMSQKIKVSAAIMFAQNPELRVGIVNDGSLLDKDNLKALAAMAEANDFQLLVEMVDDSGEIGIVIEDGEVVSGDSPKKK